MSLLQHCTPGCRVLTADLVVVNKTPALLYARETPGEVWRLQCTLVSAPHSAGNCLSDLGCFQTLNTLQNSPVLSPNVNPAFTQLKAWFLGGRVICTALQASGHIMVFGRFKFSEEEQTQFCDSHGSLLRWREKPCPRVSTTLLRIGQSIWQLSCIAKEP